MSLLFRFRPLVISPELAAKIGLNEAIVLQQLKYWINETESGIDHDGKRWVYNTHEQWAKQFPFWSVDTVKRALTSLQKQELVLVEKLARTNRDHTNYYTINYGADALIDQGNLPSSDECNLPSSASADCPDLLTEITTKTTAKSNKRSAPKPAFDLSSFPEQPSDDVWADYVGHRKSKKAPVNQTIVNQIGKELTLAFAAGWSVDDALAEAMAAGWQGLKAQWLENRNKPNEQATGRQTGGFNKQTQLEARNAKAAADFVNDIQDAYQ
ncbi:hypothetical protein D3C78_654580 [compost metagenome]